MLVSSSKNANSNRAQSGKPIRAIWRKTFTYLSLITLGSGGWLGCDPIGPEELVVVDLRVVPPGAAVSGVGATYTFSVEARTVEGALIELPPATWRSLNTNLATIDAASGRAAAVASGQVTVGAAVGGVAAYGLLTMSVPGLDVVVSWQEDMAMANTLSDVWGTSSSEVYAGGDSGIILRGLR